MITADPAAADAASIFVSYSHADRAWVSKLVRELQGAGLNIWFDAERLRPGAEWDNEIAQALARTGVLMVVLSPDSVKSRNVLDEINYALSKDRLVVPVLYRPCEVPYRIARIQHVDFTGNDAMAPIRLIDYLKAAVDNRQLPDPTPMPAPVRRPALSLGASLLVLAPTAILLALAGVAASWRLPAVVTLEVLGERVGFTAGPGASHNLLNRSQGQFSELGIEKCDSIAFSAAEFTPSQAAAARRPESDTIAVRFTCEPDSKITLRGAPGGSGLVGVLSDVRIDPGATVVLDVYGGDKQNPVLTADISTRQQFHVPIHRELEIVTDLTDLTTPALPEAVRRSLKSGKSTYRARVPESNRFIDIQTADRTVLLVTPLEENLKDFFGNDELPVESLQLAGESLEGAPVPISHGKVSYDLLPGVGAIEFSKQFLVLTETRNMFIRGLSLEPQGLKLTIGGEVVKGAIAGAPGAADTPGSIDLRRSALDTVWHGPAWRTALAAALWLASTLGIWIRVRRPHHRPAAAPSGVIN